jgi:hypothetical protein
VPDIDKPGMVRIPKLIEIAMGRYQLRKHYSEKITGLFLVFGLLINMQAGNGMEGRHSNSAFEPTIRDLPEIGFRKIVANGLRIKDDLWDHAIGPLVFEKGQDFLLGPFLIIMGIPDGDESRIPVPLVRIKTLRRLGIRAGPVAIQYLFGSSKIFLEPFV